MALIASDDIDTGYPLRDYGEANAKNFIVHTDRRSRQSERLHVC
jgi:hypothetical protein